MDSCDVVMPRGPVRLAKLAPMAMAAIGGILAAELLPGTGAGVWWTSAIAAKVERML